MKISEVEWIYRETKHFEMREPNRQWMYSDEYGGFLSIMDRMTGFGYNVRDTETAYRTADGRFCCAVGMFDIRHYPDLTIKEAIALISENRLFGDDVTVRIEEEKDDE